MVDRFMLQEIALIKLFQILGVTRGTKTLQNILVPFFRTTFCPFVSEIVLRALSLLFLNRWCKIWAATLAASGALLLGIGGYATMC